MDSIENKADSRVPGIVGVGLLLALALGFGLGQRFGTGGVEPERLPAPSAPSLFQLPAKLVVYQEGPAIPALWLDTFSSGTGNPKIDLRVLERGSDGSWPSDGDVYLVRARTYQAIGQIVPWAELSGHVPLDGMNPVFQGQAFDPTGAHSRPWRVSPWFFMKKVALGTPHKVALAAPARWAGEPQALFPNDPDLMGAIWLKSQGKPINLGGETTQQLARQQVETALSGKLASEQECWDGLKSGSVQLSFLPAWRLVLDPQAGGGLIRWSALSSGTIVDFEVMGVREESPKKEAGFRFLEFLLAGPQQAALLGATGYFPVRSKVGAEWVGSTLIMPTGPWFDKSEFILWPYPRPVVEQPVATETNSVVPASGGEQKSE
ncbi:MAG: extracellular solute-binding protein [Verrucomicrobia bacterium]|nr:extracellular solute-binding protein [Verrucomicrobiota bacterium]